MYMFANVWKPGHRNLAASSFFEEAQDLDSLYALMSSRTTPYTSTQNRAVLLATSCHILHI